MNGRSETLGKTSDDGAITAGEVRAALEVVLSSETFARADRARALLAYLVETEQNGEAPRLKGFTIAQDVFGKDDDFDPAMDAVVRVQAGRLREHLSTFYAGEGRDQPIEISVPKGTYVPSYRRRTGADGEPAPTMTGADGAGASRIVDFGNSAASFRLDSDMAAAPLAATRKLAETEGTSAQETLLSPFIVRNVKRFWLALAIIVLLLTVILFLVWQR
jgi:hypothetical protein